METQDRLPQLICEIYRIVRELEAMFPGKKFTPDGHMVGSIGEAWAGYLYDLAPFRNSSAIHDALAHDGRLVQIKTTQGNCVSTYPAPPDHLLVLRLLRDGTVEEVFNGPAAGAWTHLSKVQKNGQCTLRLSTLRKLMKEVPETDRLVLVRGRSASCVVEAPPNKQMQTKPAQAMVLRR